LCDFRDNPNYSVVSTNGILSVTPKSNSNSRWQSVYGDENPALTAVVTGAVNGDDTINYTLATTATQFSNVVEYPIAVTLELILTIVLFQLMVF
jgi:hypothetical protein